MRAPCVLLFLAGMVGCTPLSRGTAPRGRHPIDVADTPSDTQTPDAPPTDVVVEAAVDAPPPPDATDDVPIDVASLSL